MKFVVVLGDGMSDYPVDELGGRTPLQAAHKPAIDALARRGEVGLAVTIPSGMPPGSDTANLSVLGYDPRLYYTGRSPLEAASMGISLQEGEVAFRCNLVTLSDGEPYAARTMLDHSADEITSAEAHALLQTVAQELDTPTRRFYPGVSYRHLLVWSNAPNHVRLAPPHDILGQEIGPYLPEGVIGEMMRRSAVLLADHPVNRERRRRGLRPGNSIWIWGAGSRPGLPSFVDKYGLRGSVVAAVDLVKGLGVCAGLHPVHVPGATGTLHTNYRGKAEAALEELRRGQDFVYLHVEAPDECGHRQEVANKVKAIEQIDALVVRVLVDGLQNAGSDFRLLLLPDHPTPLSLRTHTHDPVPYLLYDSRRTPASAAPGYDEIIAAQSARRFDPGYRLMDYFLEVGA
ncbi:MAG: cofactor-independent phosphoglycerate mutase [Armatimonadota bacterium]|nr:cofactor-independent phosphoglycerate mutase [Armatimonadota bacterium]